MPTGTLKLKLGKCHSMPTKRLHQILARTRRDCNVARNAVIDHWRMWRRAEPDWQPQQRRDRKGELKVTKAGKPVMEHPSLSQAMEKELYYIAQQAAPNLAAKIMSACRNEVTSKLKDRVPYNHDGPSRYVWQACLNFERSYPCFVGGAIPVPNQDLVVGYDGVITPGEKSQRDVILQLTHAGCVARIPLLSKHAGYRVKAPIVNLEVAELSGGNKRLLKQIIAGNRDSEVRMCDSKITERDGKWYLQLSYKVPAHDHNLDATRVATLLPNDCRERRPFRIAAVDEKPFYIGFGVPLEKEYKRVTARRRALRHRYKSGVGKGRGSEHFYRTLKPISRAVRDEQDRFMKLLVGDVIKHCLRNNCGTLLYREPTMPLRNYLRGKRTGDPYGLWFASRDVPMDWTGFLAFLKFKCEYNGIDLQVERFGIGEFDPKPKRDAG